MILITISAVWTRSSTGSCRKASGAVSKEVSARAVAQVVQAAAAETMSEKKEKIIGPSFLQKNITICSTYILFSNLCLSANPIDWSESDSEEEDIPNSRNKKVSSHMVLCQVDFKYYTPLCEHDLWKWIKIRLIIYVVWLQIQMKSSKVLLSQSEKVKFAVIWKLFVLSKANVVKQKGSQQDSKQFIQIYPEQISICIFASLVVFIWNKKQVQINIYRHKMKKRTAVVQIARFAQGVHYRLSPGRWQNERYWRRWEVWRIRGALTNMRGFLQMGWFYKLPNYILQCR